METSLRILPNSPDPGKAGQSPQMLPVLGDSLARDYFISATVRKLEAFECFSVMDLKKILFFSKFPFDAKMYHVVVLVHKTPLVVE